MPCKFSGVNLRNSQKKRYHDQQHKDVLGLSEEIRNMIIVITENVEGNVRNVNYRFIKIDGKIERLLSMCITSL